MAVSLSEIQAQDKSTLVFKLNYNRSDFNRIQQSAGSRGVGPVKFGNWIADNGRVRASVEADRMRIPKDGQLTLYFVDSNGSIKRSMVFN